MLRARGAAVSLGLWRRYGWGAGWRIDVAGAALVAGAISWTYWTARVTGGDASPVAATFLVGVAGVLAGRVVGWRMRWAGPAVVVLGAALLFLASPDLLSGRPTSGPFGYANATGAMAVLGAVGALMLAADRRGHAGSGVWALVALAFGAVPFVIRSLTPAVLVLALPVAALVARDVRSSRAVVAAAALVFLTALSSTMVLGAHYAEAGGTPVDRAVDATITERRVALWSESLEMMRTEPVWGVGPGRFASVSPTARADRDAAWAHNEFLQQGAEQGIAGLVFLAAIFLWAFVRLWAHARDAVAAIAAVGLAILGIHACVDYVLRFPAVPLAAALLVGTAMAQRGDPDASGYARP